MTVRLTAAGCGMSGTVKVPETLVVHYLAGFPVKLWALQALTCIPL